MHPATADKSHPAAARQVRPYAGRRYGWIIAVTGALAVLAALGFGRHSYTVIISSMKEGLGLSEVQAGDLATGTMLGYLASSVLGGALASRLGPRVVISVSLFLGAASLLFTGLAASYPSALAARILTGIASGGANVPVMGLVSSWFAARQRGVATGIAVAGSSAGLLLTGLAVPAIIAACGTTGWRVSWFVMAAAAFAAAVVCSLVLRNSPAARHRQGRAPHSLGRVLGSGRMWYLGAVYSLFGFSYIIYSTFFARYLTSEAGFSARAAGALWSGVGLASLASGFLWGTVSDRLGRKHGLAIVYALQFAGFFLFGAWQAPAAYWLSAALFALTAWSVPAIMAAAAGDVMGARLAPAALGMLTAFFGIGQAAGPFVAARIAQASGSYRGAFLVAAGAALAGAVLSTMLRLGKQGAGRSG
jgi:predicted MFS family arabinose efflux permease